MGHPGPERMDGDFRMANGTMRWWRSLCLVWPLLVVGVAGAHAQGAARSCKFICDLEWKFEPTFTIENLANRQRVVGPDGSTERVSRERVFETVLALGMKARVPRLGFTAEMSAAPFNDDNAAQLEFESNFYWLT